jgi:DnaJ-class molecular chaperone
MTRPVPGEAPVRREGRVEERCSKHKTLLTEVDCRRCDGEGEEENHDYGNPLNFHGQYLRCLSCGGARTELICEDCQYEDENDGGAR